jgi:hypothetical protein
LIKIAKTIWREKKSVEGTTTRRRFIDFCPFRLEDGGEEASEFIRRNMKKG